MVKQGQKQLKLGDELQLKGIIKLLFESFKRKDSVLIPGGMWIDCKGERFKKSSF